MRMVDGDSLPYVRRYVSDEHVSVRWNFILRIHPNMYIIYHMICTSIFYCAPEVTYFLAMTGMRACPTPYFASLLPNANM